MSGDRLGDLAFFVGVGLTVAVVIGVLCWLVDRQVEPWRR